MQHTLTTVDDSLTTGSIYSFKWRALNDKGYSDFSSNVYVAASSPPSQASTPSVNYDFSDRNSLYVTWNASPDGTGDGGLITGYKLYMDDGRGGNY